MLGATLGVLALAAMPGLARTPAAPNNPEEPPAEAPEPEAALEPDEGRLVIDILSIPDQPEDPEAARECEQQQDLARLANEIVVCRELQGADVSGFDKQDWERRYAERTQGIKTPDVEGAGGRPLYRQLGSVAMVTVSASFGDPPEPALIIDIEALPEAPPGSDADRVANGLPPIGPE